MTTSRCTVSRRVDHPQRRRHEWTIKVRSGIKFTDGTPVNADAVIDNFQRSGLGLLLAAQLVDLAKVDDPERRQERRRLGEEGLQDRQGRRLDLHDLHRQGRRPGAAAAVAGLRLLPHRAVRPDRLARRGSRLSMPTRPRPRNRSAPARSSCRATRRATRWSSPRTRTTGRRTPTACSCRTSTRSRSRSSRTRPTAFGALKSGDIDVFADSNGAVIKDVIDDGSFEIAKQTQFGETNYLLVDIAKPGPYGDARVRCALSMAIDRQEIIDLTGGGLTDAGQRPVLARPRGLPRRQRLRHRPGHRRRQGADRRLQEGPPRHRCRSPTATPPTAPAIRSPSC